VLTIDDIKLMEKVPGVILEEIKSKTASKLIV